MIYRIPSFMKATAVAKALGMTSSALSKKMSGDLTWTDKNQADWESFHRKALEEVRGMATTTEPKGFN